MLGPGLGCAPPFLAGLSGCVFWAFCFVVSVAGCPCPGPCGPCPPIPFLSGWAASTFFFVVCVCMFRCPFSRWAAVPGLVLPVLAGWSPCASLGVLSSVPPWGGVWPPLVVLAGGLVAVGCFCAPPPYPLRFFLFLGGGGCLFLPLPSLGWRTHWPAFSVVFRAAVGGCILSGRVLAPWVGLAMYTLGSAPLLAGLGPGSASSAAAPGGCVWLWARGLGLFVSFPLCGAGFNLLGGPPLLLLGARWPLCVACSVCVWRAGAAPSRVCGGLLRLVLQVRVSRAVLCHSVPRQVASCCGALHCGVLWCGVPWSRVVPRWVIWWSAWPVSRCGVRAGVWLAGGWGVRLGVGVSLGPCCGGLGMPLGLVGRVGVRGVALPGGLCLGPVSSGGFGP